MLMAFERDTIWSFRRVSCPEVPWLGDLSIDQMDLFWRSRNDHHHNIQHQSKLTIIDVIVSPCIMGGNEVERCQ